MANPVDGFTNSGTLDASATSRSGSIYGAPVTVGGINFPPEKNTAIWWAMLFVISALVAYIVIHHFRG